ncbi:uncharacterized protein N0V89_012261 [Didymosphaeria variabile]|uniref:Uncharacterized protein n=1 Tax=Didymosphaeria variabile TaxID=1932322 RepID=A0A9W9C4A5_9PLEO|nr:uncharacterized protein N0V89_012261 [Didymosphaeria variabile]KAJ4344518.1 hypothetical protein N0V89_012261 [Didymosphaeria variabile]
MRFLHLAATLALAVLGTAWPVEDTVPPAIVNMTAQHPSSIREDLPNYHMLELFTEPYKSGMMYYIDRIMVKYATCVNWLDVDQVGGITSLESYKNQQGLVYYCQMYK